MPDLDEVGVGGGVATPVGTRALVERSRGEDGGGCEQLRLEDHIRIISTQNTNTINSTHSLLSKIFNPRKKITGCRIPRCQARLVINNSGRRQSGPVRSKVRKRSQNKKKKTHTLTLQNKGSWRTHAVLDAVGLRPETADQHQTKGRVC